MNRHKVFETEMVPHYAMIRSYAMTFAQGNEAVAQDLTQDTMLRAWKYLDGYKPGSNAKGWLYTMLRREHLRRVERGGWVDRCLRLDDIEYGSVEAGHMYDPEYSLRRVRLLDTVKEAFGKIHPGFRASVMLVLLGYTLAETAEDLQRPEGTLMAQRFRGKRDLRRLLRRHVTEWGIQEKPDGK